MNQSLPLQPNNPTNPVITPVVPTEKFHFNFGLLIIGLSILAFVSVGVLGIVIAKRSAQSVVIITDPQSLAQNYVNQSLRPEYRQPFELTPFQDLDYRLTAGWKIEKSWFNIDFHQFRVNNIFEPRLIFLSIVQSGHPDLDKNVAAELIDKYLLSSPEMKAAPFQIYFSFLGIPIYEKIVQNEDKTIESRMVSYYDSSTRSAVLVKACRLYPGTFYYDNQRCFAEYKR